MYLRLKIKIEQKQWMNVWIKSNQHFIITNIIINLINNKKGVANDLVSLESDSLSL